MEKKVKEKKNIAKKENVEKKENIVLHDNEKKLIKFTALLASFFASGLALLILIFSIISTIAVAKLPKADLINNNIVVTLVSKLNNYSNVDTTNLISNITNKFTFIAFEIIIPMFAFIGAMILIIVLSKKVLDLISNVKYEKELFTLKKLDVVKDIISLLSLILLTLLVLFNEPVIILYLIIELLLFIIYALFKKCVNERK